jgi:hypothetical protein
MVVLFSDENHAISGDNVLMSFQLIRCLAIDGIGDLKNDFERGGTKS